MFNYKMIIQWHEDKNSNTEQNNSDSMFEDDYFKIKFDQGIGRIWQVITQFEFYFLFSLIFAFFFLNKHNILIS